MVKIAEVQENSLASRKGIEAGDKLIAVNDKKPEDYIDFQYETAETFFTLKIEKKSGDIKTYNIQRRYRERLGLFFDNIIFDNLKTCNNDCIFCFVKQQPGDMRSSLLKRDDDYRFSFLQGSFITLTNLSQTDWDKIISHRLSPLYISVHTTNPDLRSKMMQNPKAANIMNDLQKLADNSIKFHTQIVLCPGINDEQELTNTIKDLSSLYPAVKSLGIVPVGLTKYRQNQFPLSTYNKEKAEQVLDKVQYWQHKTKNRHGKNWIFAADEFYFLAGKNIPSDEHYGSYPQIENGIGLTRLLWQQLTSIEEDIPIKAESQSIGIITGKLGSKALKPIINRFNEIKGIKILTLPITNRYFGKKVTVTGLLTGQDIISYLKKNNTPKKIIIPGITLNDNNLFLDNIKPIDINNKFPDKKIIIADTLQDIVEVIKNE